MSHNSSLTVAQQGFDAWRRGDFDALEAIFVPWVARTRFCERRAAGRGRVCSAR